MAGGLTNLSKMPACNIMLLGAQRKTLSGFSSTSVLPHTGYIYHSDIVQSLPPVSCCRPLHVAPRGGFCRAGSSLVQRASAPSAPQFPLVRTDEHGQELRGQGHMGHWNKDPGADVLELGF